MLDALQREMERVHASRRLIRIGAGAAVLLLCIGAGAVVATRMSGSAPARTAAPLANRGVRSAESAVDRTSSPPSRVEIVESTRGAYRHIEVIDDEALLRALDRAGRPTGLVRIGGQVALTSEVTDPPGDPSL